MNTSVNISQISYSQSKTLNETTKNEKTALENAPTKIQKETPIVAATYEPKNEEETLAQLGKYTVDMEKVQAMKDETDQHLLELFKDTVRGTSLKQLGGVRGILEKLRNGEKVTLEIEYTAKDVEQAKIDVAKGGYWSAEETSTRLVDFAKALSGGNPAKAKMLKEAFVKAFKEIEEMFGGELPDLSYDTYDLTMDKFAAWETESN